MAEAEQTLDRRQRRLETHDALFTFEALEHRGLLAAYIRTGAEVQLDIEIKAAAIDVFTEPARVPGERDGLRQYAVSERIF